MTEGDHTHEFAVLRWESAAPVPPGPPSHTAFLIFTCACGAVSVFPRGNYDLTTDAYRRAFDAEMAAHGWHWEASMWTEDADA